jgi:pyruvate dehydrogenase E2 component (dihydrolipoamide acetyltransferase)
MAEIIEMPKLSDTMTSGTLVKWLKKEGDTVTNGDKLAEVETDKATMELENFEDGVLLRHYVGEGEEVEIGRPVCAIGEEGEEAPDPTGDGGGAPESPEGGEAANGDEASSAAEPTPESPLAPAEPTAEPAPSTGRRKVSPLARKLAEEHGIDLARLTGSGTNGRIVKADVEKAVEEGLPAAPATEPAPATAGSTTPAEESVREIGPAPAPAPTPLPQLESKEEPVSNMRATIARRLLESKTSIPHYYLEIEVDMGPLLDLRQSINTGLADLPPEQGGAKFTVNHFFLKACAEAIRRAPAINSTWAGDKVLRHGEVHLAFAVAVEEGLVTPVIRNADRKGLRQIGAEANELTEKARQKKLTPAEMSDSTFTLTNLGMFGITSFFGIINPPNAAILSIGATVEKPVVVDGALAVGRRTTLGLSADHRVVDGAVGASFLQALRTVLESPSVLLV